MSGEVRGRASRRGAGAWGAAPRACGVAGLNSGTMPPLLGDDGALDGLWADMMAAQVSFRLPAREQALLTREIAGMRAPHSAGACSALFDCQTCLLSSRRGRQRWEKNLQRGANERAQGGHDHGAARGLRAEGVPCAPFSTPARVSSRSSALVVMTGGGSSDVASAEGDSSAWLCSAMAACLSGTGAAMAAVVRAVRLVSALHGF